MPVDKPLRLAGFFLLRTPALPLDGLAALRAEYENGIAPQDSALLADPLVREALFLASPHLSERLEDEADARLGLSVARYLYRMFERPTPFGMCAGVSLGTVGATFALETCETKDAERVCRIDQAAISDLQARLRASEDFLRHATLAVNTLLWQAPDGFRYIELVPGSGEHKLARMKATAALRMVHARLAAPMPFAALAGALAREFGTAEDKAAGFLAMLVREQFLIALPQIAVTGDDAVKDFAAELSRNPAAENDTRMLNAAIGALARIGTDGARNIALYREAAASLGERAVQVDMHKRDCAPELPQALLERVLDQLWNLRAFLCEPANAQLRDFADAFEKRYGDMAVPLLEALDTDFGLGFGQFARPGAPMLEGITGSARAEGIVKFKPVEVMLLGKLERAQSGRDILLDDGDLESIATEADDLPSSFSVLGSFGDCFEFGGMSSVPGAALFGRFCCGDDALTRRVRDFVAETEGDTADLLIAEVAHLPDGRAGNVMLRPVLRSHEIAYMGHSGAARQIAPSDLYLVCRNGQVGLFSKSLAKRILPRLTSAHVFSEKHGLPVYRFLGLLQSQNEACPRQPWGALADRLAFLPGIRYRDIRLAAPRTNLDRAETKALSQGKSVARLAGRHMRLLQGDNYLDLDLERSLDRALLAEEARRSQTLTLEERAPCASARDASGRALAHEVVLPVFRGHPARKLVRLRMPEADAGPKPPGGDWLYARIHCGTSAMDRVIVEDVPAFETFARSQGCDRVYFLRYDEDGGHLRLRVHGAPEALWSAMREKLEALLAPRLAAREVTRFDYATYQPEIDRYGGAQALALCEHIFAADSIAVARALVMPVEERWKLALASMLDLARSFAFDGERELAVLKSLAGNYRREFSLSKAERDALNDKYRAHRVEIDAVVLNARHPDAAVDMALAARHQAVTPLAEALKSILPAPRVDEIAMSLLHMTANRILPDRARLHELVLLHFIVKSLESARGRAAYLARASG